MSRSASAGFAYVDGRLSDGDVLPLCRLRYGGSATFWGFAIYLASTDRYEDSVLPTPPTTFGPCESNTSVIRIGSRCSRLAGRVRPPTTLRRCVGR